MHARERVEAVLRRFPRPDTVLTCANGGWFDRPEAEALQAVFAGVPARAPKEAFGETLGCGYMLNVLYGAALLREGSCGSVLACGADMIGNYCCAMLERA